MEAYIKARSEVFNTQQLNQHGEGLDYFHLVHKERFIQRLTRLFQRQKGQLRRVFSIESLLIVRLQKLHPSRKQISFFLQQSTVVRLSQRLSENKSENWPLEQSNFAQRVLSTNMMQIT
jgi:hypothetical protein